MDSERTCKNEQMMNQCLKDTGKKKTQGGNESLEIWGIIQQTKMSEVFLYNTFCVKFNDLKLVKWLLLNALLLI